MKFPLFILLLLQVYASLRASIVNPEAYMDFIEYCQFLRYPVTPYWVTTPDGYILNLFRIGKKHSKTFNSGTPIFMQHGLVDSSDDWIINDEDIAPGFILVNLGYDIWFGNTRGNHHSRNHTTLNPNTDPLFWNYTWNEMAQYDIPTEINFVLNFTGYQKLVYIGHSQGTTIIMAHLIEHPEFASKLAVSILLAPIATVMHQTSKVLSDANHPEFFDLMAMFGIDEVFKKDSLIMPWICEYLNLVCKDVVDMIADSDGNVDNNERLDVIMGHYPSSDSLKNIKMWSQMALYKEPRMQKFDYEDPIKNYEIYGSAKPPVYNLTSLTSNFGLFGGEYDRLGDQVDVQWLKSQIVNANIMWYKDDYPLGHGTFMWFKNSTWFNDVISLIKKVV
mmetsp:Transcript_1393/g.1382  ORF Transcript_1393/g.1382 Transcript_1393/m.1382 type:complete len:390 (-) Transcript_1393:13-1182(-)